MMFIEETLKNGIEVWVCPHCPVKIPAVGGKVPQVEAHERSHHALSSS